MYCGVWLILIPFCNNSTFMHLLQKRMIDKIAHKKLKGGGGAGAQKGISSGRRLSNNCYKSLLVAFTSNV